MIPAPTSRATHPAETGVPVHGARPDWLRSANSNPRQLPGPTGGPRTGPGRPARPRGPPQPAYRRYQFGFVPHIHAPGIRQRARTETPSPTPGPPAPELASFRAFIDTGPRPLAPDWLRSAYSSTRHTRRHTCPLLPATLGATLPGRSPAPELASFRKFQSLASSQSRTRSGTLRSVGVRNAPVVFRLRTSKPLIPRQIIAILNTVPL
jgi:hypothetical protein